MAGIPVQSVYLVRGCVGNHFGSSEPSLSTLGKYRPGKPAAHNYRLLSINYSLLHDRELPEPYLEGRWPVIWGFLVSIMGYFGGIPRDPV